MVYSGIGAAILAAIVMTANFIVSYAPLRMDMSEGKIYSLSPGSKKILKELDDNLVVQVAFSRNLPPPYSLNEKYVHNLLAEYRRASQGHIKIEFIDPSSSDRLKQDVISAGVVPAQLDVREKDRRELKECFMGLVFHYRQRREVVPFIQDVQSLEYEITQRIKKLVNPVKPRIGIISAGNPLLLQSQELTTAGAYASQLYEVVGVDLISDIPADIKALWLIGPTQKLEDAQLAKIKTWVEDGGTLGLLVDQYTVDIQRFQPTEVDSGFGPLLKEWGIILKKGLVYDTQSDRIQLQSQQGYFKMVNVIDYPYFPLTSDLNRTNPATRDLDAISLPFASPIEIEPVEGITHAPLARSSKQSWLNSSPFAISPVVELSKPAQAAIGPFNLAVLAEGKFKKGDAGAKIGRVIVFGCSRFVRSDYPLRPANYAAFINFMDWSTQDEILLSIRAKANPRRPLRDMGTAPRLFVKFLMITFLPLMVIAVGIVVWFWQRTRRSHLAAVYRGE